MKLLGDLWVIQIGIEPLSASTACYFSEAEAKAKAAEFENLKAQGYSVVWLRLIDAIDLTVSEAREDSGEG